MMLIDTHCHLYSKDFQTDRQEVILRARQAGLSKIYLPNVDLESIPGMLLLEENESGFCHVMMGLHPCSVENDFEDVCQMYIFIIEKDKDGNNILPTTKADYWFAGDSSDYHINLGFDIKDGGKEVYILPRWSNPEGNGDFGKQVILTIPR